MKQALANEGLSHLAISESAKGHNQILIASRSPLSFGVLAGPTISGDSGSNFLHVILPERALELVGFRVPVYAEAVDGENFWKAFIDLAMASSDRPIVYIGDMNADPDSNRTVGGHALSALRQAGWQIPRAQGEWSHCSSRARRRIDHALVAADISVQSAAYCPVVGNVVCAGVAKDLYSHAPLMIEVMVPDTART